MVFVKIALVNFFTIFIVTMDIIHSHTRIGCHPCASAVEIVVLTIPVNFYAVVEAQELSVFLVFDAASLVVHHCDDSIIIVF